MTVSWRRAGEDERKSETSKQARNMESNKEKV